MTALFASLRREPLTWLGLALGISALFALALWQMQLVGDFRIDDAYITFSFSKNLAAGNGPIFSHGVRVEGYSNFLWMLLMVPTYLVAPDADPYWWARGLSLLFLLAALVAVFRLVRKHAGALAGLLSCAVVLSSTDVMRAALSGLETAPFLACITLGWCAYFKRTPPCWCAMAWFVAAALMRIDGFVPLLIVIGYEFVCAMSERRLRWLPFLRWVVPGVAAWALYFAWRYWYYGLPLPTTYYAKTVVTVGDPDRAYNQLWGFYRDYGVLGLVPLALIPLFRGPRRVAWGVGLAVLLQLAYSTQTGGDWMPFQRFLLPVLPLLSILVGIGAARWWRELGPLVWLPRLAAAGALLGGLGFSLVRMHAASVDTPEESGKLGNARHTIQHTRENLLDNADLMRFVPRRPGENLVTDYAGVFSVYTDAAIIDMWGLCNADIALNGSTRGVNPVYGKSCVECYRRLNPQYFHVVIPIVRDANAFASQRQVIQNVFLGPEIDREIDLQRKFVTGRLVEAKTGRALWFLEKRRAGLSYEPRSPAPGLRIDYPFFG